MNKSNFIIEKRNGSVHMTVFKIVVHCSQCRQLDTIIGMMYLGADNSTTEVKGL